MRKIDFAVVGAAKCSTSSLSDYLDSVPGVTVLKPKDGHFFTVDPATGGFKQWGGPTGKSFNSAVERARETVPHQLENAPPGEIIGEASVFYLFDREALERLNSSLSPNGVVIVVLRRPDERAYSAYSHMVRDGHETFTFEKALDLEHSRIRENWEPIWWYKSLGHYASQVESLYDIFGRSRVHVLLFEDVVEDVTGALSGVTDALSIDLGRGSLPHTNSGGAPRSRRLQKFLAKPNVIKSTFRDIIPVGLWRKVRARLELLNVDKSPMPRDVRAKLVSDYIEDIAKLEVLIKRDLSAWKK